MYEYTQFLYFEIIMRIELFTKTILHARMNLSAVLIAVTIIAILYPFQIQSSRVYYQISWQVIGKIVGNNSFKHEFQ